METTHDTTLWFPRCRRVSFWRHICMSHSRMLKPSGWEAAGLNETTCRFSVARGLFLKENTLYLNQLRNITCTLQMSIILKYSRVTDLSMVMDTTH